MVGEFSVHPWEFTEQDLQRLVRDKIQEGRHLEYKRSTLLQDRSRSIQDLTKEVSAFNNADGGIIAIGIEEAGEGRRFKFASKVDDGVSNAEFPVTWLNQIINSNIDPSIHELRTVAVPLSAGVGQVAFVIWVPRGKRAVQASDLKYYQRQEDRSVPMKDFQVRDVNNRMEGPDISLRLEFPDGGFLNRTEGQHQFATIRPTIMARNASDTIPEAAVFRLIIPSSILNPDTEREPRWRTEDRNPEIRLLLEDDVHRRDRAIIFTRLFPEAIDPPFFSGWGDMAIGVVNLIFKTGYFNSQHLEPVLLMAASPSMETRIWPIELSTGGHTVGAHLLDGTGRTITLDDLEPLEYFRSH